MAEEPVQDSEESKDQTESTETKSDTDSQEEINNDVKEIIENKEDFDAKVLDEDAAADKAEESIEDAEEAKAPEENSEQANEKEEESSPEEAANEENKEEGNDETEEKDSETAEDSETTEEDTEADNKEVTEEERILAIVKKYVLKVIGITLLIVLSVLFYLIALETIMEEEHKALKGYVLVNHKLPEGFKKEVPAEIQEIIDEYNKKHHSKPFNEDYRFHGPNEKNMGDQFPESLNNADLLLILEYQKIGEVTRAGVDNTAKMNLSGLDLRKIDFYYLKNFVQSNLRRANLSYVQNTDAIFRAASLEKANFTGANLEHGKFIRSRMNGVIFKASNIANCDFRKAKAHKAIFSRANMTKSNFEKVDFSHSEFDHAIIVESRFHSSKLDGSNFSNARLSGSDFSNAQLQGSDMSDADLRYVDFTGANLEGVNFTGANLEHAKLKDATVNEAVFAKVKGASLEQLRETKFLNAARKVPAKLFPKKLSWKERF